MKKWGKWIIGIVVISILVAYSYSSKVVNVDTTSAKKAVVFSTVTEKGKITATDKRDIYSEIQGKVKQVRVDIGDEVASKTLLAILDVSDLEGQLAQLAGEMRALQGSQKAATQQLTNNNIKQQEALVIEAKIAVVSAKSNYERLQNLYAEGAVTAVDLEQAKTELDISKQSLAKSQAALSQSNADTSQLNWQKSGINTQYEGQRQSLQAKINYLAQQKLKGKIFATDSGMILAKNINTGDFVNTGTILFSVGKTDSLSIETFVSSKDLANIHKKDNVDVIFKLVGQDIKVGGTITRIAPVAEEKTSALGILEDKVKVNIELIKKPEGINLIPGMMVDVILFTNKTTEVIAVPKDSVFADAGVDFVWIVESGKAKLTEVIKGIEGDDTVEIKRGLNDGEHIILDPHNVLLKENIAVKEQLK